MSVATMRGQLLIPYTVLVVSAGLTAFATLAPVPGRPVAAFFPPWWTPAEGFVAAAAADAAIIRTGAFATILVLAAGSSTLPHRLRSAGAWLVLDARFTGGCAAPQNSAAPVPPQHKGYPE